MERLGEIFVQGQMVNLDQASAKELESYLRSVQNDKEKLKNQLDEILEEIYN